MLRMAFTHDKTIDVGARVRVVATHREFLGYGVYLGHAYPPDRAQPEACILLPRGEIIYSGDCFWADHLDQEPEALVFEIALADSTRYLVRKGEIFEGAGRIGKHEKLRLSLPIGAIVQGEPRVLLRFFHQGADAYVVASELAWPRYDAKRAAAA